MNTNEKCAAIASLLILLLCVSLAGTVFAQASPAMLGVSQGDSFKYDITFFWRSTNPADAIPPYLLEENHTTYFQTVVQLAAGTTVQLQTTWQFDNGTQVNNTQLSEVSGGTASSIYMYAANLTAGGKLFPLSTDLPWVINQTVVRTYAGGYRPTNHIEVNNTGMEGKVYSDMDLYFDQQTGALVEYTLTEVNTDTPSQTITQHVALIETNRWTMPSASTGPTNYQTSPTAAPSQNNNTNSSGSTGLTSYILIALAIVFAALIVAILLVVTRRSKKGPKQPPTLMPTPTLTQTQTPPPPNEVNTANQCSKCGHENPETNEFCGKCGTRLHK